jgi:TPP-dependent pyruvate/acetoin dehydrogenase alpha subunit
MINNFSTDVFSKISFCRHFENVVYEKIQDKTIRVPTYLSAGQESIPCSIATYVQSINVDPNIFIQHRGHSTYLAFDASPKQLVD